MWYDFSLQLNAETPYSTWRFILYQFLFLLFALLVAALSCSNPSAYGGPNLLPHAG